jgi:serine/threonine-protein kinase
LPPSETATKAVRASPAVMALIGRVVDGKYGVRAVIGEGGMGAVYEAEHLVLGRLVALKVLNASNAAKPDAVSRFKHEARVAGSIGHPNICEIYDVGKLEDGTPFLVMERLLGDSLADRINREGALPFGDVLEISLQILSGLAAAHRKGIIHRDMKPENIFLSARVGCDPIAKLLDFGISKVSNLDADLHLTRTGMVMGTPYYMAPEQARGDRIDQRVDLYAMGVILYECLTGRRPFTAPNYNALLVQILSGEPKPMRSIRPAIPVSFEPIVIKAMQKAPEQRFQTASEFLEALTKLRNEFAREERLLKAEAERRADASGPQQGPPRRDASGPQQGLPRRDGSSPSLSPPRPSVPPLDIPVHFSPGTGSGEVASLAKVPRLSPSRPDVGDTYVDELDPGGFDDPSEATQVDRPHLAPESAPPTPTPVVGPGAPGLRVPPLPPLPGLSGRAPLTYDQTVKSRPIDAAEAEEIIRAAQRRARASSEAAEGDRATVRPPGPTGPKGPNPLAPRSPPAPAPKAPNPLRPAAPVVEASALPSRLQERAPIPREERPPEPPPFVPAPPRAPGAREPAAPRSPFVPPAPPAFVPTPPRQQVAAPHAGEEEEPTRLFRHRLAEEGLIPRPGVRSVPPPAPPAPPPAPGSPSAPTVIPPAPPPKK